MCEISESVESVASVQTGRGHGVGQFEAYCMHVDVQATDQRPSQAENHVRAN